jgi:hypothetical protein
LLGFRAGHSSYAADPASSDSVSDDVVQRAGGQQRDERDREAEGDACDWDDAADHLAAA